MTTAQVVEASDTVNNNSPIRDYVHPDDHTQPTNHFDSEDDNRTGCRSVRPSDTVNNNSPIQDYVHPDDQTQLTYEMTHGFKPFTKR